MPEVTYGMVISFDVDAELNKTLRRLFSCRRGDWSAVQPRKSVKMWQEF